MVAIIHVSEYVWLLASCMSIAGNSCFSQVFPATFS